MKRNKIMYYVTTGLVSAGFLMSSVMYLTKNTELMSNFSRLGYPAYFVTILGVAKLLGALALLNPWYAKLREWAYAGFAFILIGAIWTHIATGTSFAAPLVFAVLISASYLFHQKVNVREMQLA